MEDAPHHAKGSAIADLITDLDKRLVRNGYTHPTLGPALRGAVSFRRAEARLAEKNIVWSPELQEFTPAPP